MNACIKAQKDAALKKLLGIKEQGASTPGTMKVIADECGIPLDTFYEWSSRMPRTT